MATDYISREAAIVEIKRFIGYLDEDMIERVQVAIKRIPAADVVTRDAFDRILAEKDELGRGLNGAILLFHDRLPTTVAALEEAIPWLQEQGYDLVTVTELIESSGQAIEYGKDYRRKPGY